MEPRIQYALTSDGVRIAYWKVGASPVMIVTPYHRASSHVEMDWGNELRRSIFLRLAEQMAVVRYDGRGTGLSQRDLDFRLDARQRDLLAVAAALNQPPYIIIAMRSPSSVPSPGSALWSRCAHAATGC